MAESTPTATVPSGDPLPTGHATLRAVAMPSDTNPNGDIFGGWLLSQMDLAGGIAAYERAGGRVATVAVDALSFHEPVSVGDVVSCYARVDRVGRTSIRVAIETYVRRRDGGHTEKVTEGSFVYVAMDTNGRPRAVDP